MRKICTFTKIEFKNISLHRMENKKLLMILLKDLSELDEMVAEKEASSLDELEMEFLHTRVKGAKKIIQILYERESNTQIEKKEKEKVEVVEKPVEKKQVEETAKEEPKTKHISELAAEPLIHQEKMVEEVPAEKEKEIEVSDHVIQPKEEIEEAVEVVREEKVKKPEAVEDKGVMLEEEKVVAAAGHTLGDSFSKEKSINDLVGVASEKLEHKLSNRPVANIQAAIGINDRFQFIRELFDGKADQFTEAVLELDKMSDIQQAVKYLQQNYQWKKDETSLKFVNLVKRRFSNE
jgi:hypothetical protein